METDFTKSQMQRLKMLDSMELVYLEDELFSDDGLTDCDYRKAVEKKIAEREVKR